MSSLPESFPVPSARKRGGARSRVLALSGLVLAFGACTPAWGQAAWKAGAASVVVTPPGPAWMAGFASRDKPSDGVTADLRVKALALQDGAGQTSVIVTADLISFSRSLAGVIAERCQKQYGIPRDRLVLNASHTHSGPALSLGGSSRGSRRTAAEQQATEKYTRDLVDRTVGVVGRAMETLAPATVEFSQGLAGFAVNRRRSRPNTRQLPGPVDHDVPVLAVRAPDGKLRAVLFGYACHATTMSAYQINADYPGYAQAALEASYPGAIALFMQGCGADSNPLPRYHSEDPALIQRSLELCTMYGKILASAVDLVLRTKMTPVAGPIRAAFEVVDIPFEPRPSREELEVRRKDPEVNRRAQRSG